MSTHRAINFSAGPSKVPEEVLREAQAELLNYDGTGISVMELSHRSSTFGKIIADTEKDLRDVLSIPDSYTVLFMHGGGTGMFAAIPLNLLQNKSDVADYLVTGSWSDKAKKEADKYITAREVVPKRKNYQNVPDLSEWNLSPNAKYLYYCDNETIYGVEFPNIPSLNNGAYLVADMSSNFLTRQFDVTKYGLIYAAVQKNVGIAGLAIVIVRNDLIGDPMTITPSILNFKLMKENKSLYNTPPCFQIYITGLFLKWIKKNGGLKAMEEMSRKKSSLIYDVIDNSSGFYCSPVERSCRSRVNIPFRVGGSEGNTELEAKFLEEAEAHHMVQLKGHRSVGGIRASIYNAMTLEETKVLEKFMRDFALRNA